jgi:hypothetical protein
MPRHMDKRSSIWYYIIMSEKEKPILIYRGMKTEHDRERIGHWWITDPYHALVYSNNGAGQMFVASVDRTELAEHAKDASTEGLRTYYFADQDPSSARLATPEEIEALRTATTFSIEDRSITGGIKTPDNGIEIGESIFGPKDIGSVALVDTGRQPDK